MPFISVSLYQGRVLLWVEHGFDGFATSLKLFTFFIVSDLLDLCCNILNKALTFLIFEQKFSKNKQCCSSDLMHLLYFNSDLKCEDHQDGKKSIVF